MLEDPDLHHSAAFERGALMPQSRGSMMVARAVDPQPGERILDLCAAPGEDHSSGALTGDAGEVVAVEHDPRRGRTCARTPRASAPAACAWWSGRVAARPRQRLRPRAGRPAVLGPRDAPVPPRRPLAQDTAAGRAAVIAAATHPRGGRPPCGRAGGWCTRRARSAPPRTSARWRSSRASSRVRPDEGRPFRSDSPAPRRHGRVLHRSLRATWMTSRRAAPDTSAIPFSPDRSCPSCGEPWLRPTQLAGRYRCVYCLTRFQLMAYCPAASTRRSCA